MIANIILLATGIGLLVTLVLMELGFPYWSYYLAMPILALLFYGLNVVLITHYVEKRTPEYASGEEISKEVRKWELTAGKDVVPKWVSWIGLASISSLLALLMPFVAGLFN